MGVVTFLEEMELFIEKPLKRGYSRGMQKVRNLKRRGASLVAGCAALIMSLSCAQSRPAAETEGSGVAEEVLSKLGKRTIYFAHQSVGYNILDGVGYYGGTALSLQDISADQGVSFPQGPVFAHSTIGENTKPLTKLSDFAYRIENGIGGAADIAALKFCYIDFDRDTDVDALFKAYSAEIARLQGKFPRLSFVHFTVPLTVTKRDLKTRIKGLLGREPEGAAENLVRQKYNELVRSAYPGAVFDIARVESTRPDGAREEGLLGGERYYSLLDSYTTDGGHLNEYASRLAAREFLTFLSTINK